MKKLFALFSLILATTPTLAQQLSPAFVLAQPANAISLPLTGNTLPCGTIPFIYRSLAPATPSRGTVLFFSGLPGNLLFLDKGAATVTGSTITGYNQTAPGWQMEADLYNAGYTIADVSWNSSTNWTNVPAQTAGDTSPLGNGAGGPCTAGNSTGADPTVAFTNLYKYSQFAASAVFAILGEHSTPTSASGNGTIVTFNLPVPLPTAFAPGELVTVAGMTTTGLNGQQFVAATPAPTKSTFSIINTTTGTLTLGGTISGGDPTVDYAVGHSQGSMTVAGFETTNAFVPLNASIMMSPVAQDLLSGASSTHNGLTAYCRVSTTKCRFNGGWNNVLQLVPTDDWNFSGAVFNPATFCTSVLGNATYPTDCVDALAANPALSTELVNNSIYGMWANEGVTDLQNGTDCGGSPCGNRALTFIGSLDWGQGADQAYFNERKAVNGLGNEFIIPGGNHDFNNWAPLGPSGYAVPVAIRAWINGLSPIVTAKPVPTLIAGAFAPKGQTTAMPSVSTEPVRCGPQVDNAGNSIWGTGCDHTTGFCTAPTTGSPYQPCQPPQMLFPTGGTGNGTTAQILYTSYASVTYPVGEAIIIGQPGGTHQATQANWNTPNSHANGFATSASNALCPASGPSVTLTLSDSASANPYAISGPNSTIYINGVTGSGAGQYPSFGWTTGNPNGMFSLVAVGGSTGAWTITYCTGTQVTGTYLQNADHYSGIVTSPYIATSSNCNIGSNPFACQVSFLNPHSCTSSCVSADTQFIAGQFDDLIINHHFGEQVPLSEQNGVVEPCAIDSNISGTSANPAFSMYAELDGGAFVKTTSITDPRGTGASGLSTPPKKVYCVQFNAAAVADGEHEISWIGCPLVGICGRLSSTQAIDAESGSSTFFKANNHALVGGTILGVVASPDAQFPVFDWTQSTLRSLNGGNSNINVTSISMATGFATFNFTASPIVGQFKAGSTVGISGMVTGNSCTIAPGSTSNGSILTINLTGTCVFPTGSTVNIAAIVVSGGNGFAWNGTIVKVSSGATCTTTCSIQVPSLSTATYVSGGTVTANLNGQCVVSSSTSTKIVCPTLADTSTTRVSGGSISSTANLLCAPGGNGDDPAPYDPAGGTEVSQFFPDSFQLIPYTASPATCGLVAGQTGCFGSACGRLPTQQETLWITRFEAGIDEREVFNSIMPKLETGSYFVWTNAGGTIARKNVWVDSWNQSAVKTGCYSSSTPCGDLSHALYALQATSANTTTVLTVPTRGAGDQILTNQAVTNCLVFSNIGNVSGAIPLYDHEPIEFVAYDSNTNAQLSQFGLYWIVGVGSTETGAANGITLSATNGGTCITDTASGIFGGFLNAASTAWLVNDLGFDNIYLACNASLGCTAWNPSTQTGNPETYDWKVVTTAAATAPIYARSSYLNIGPDTTNGVTGHQVSVLNGTSNFFPNASITTQGGRIHKTADSIDNDLLLTPVVALGPTLPIITAVTGGSLATCPAPNAAHQCETLTFAAHKNPATGANDGSTFQAPTATNPLGQAIIVSGVVSTDSPTTTWNCGASIAAPCGGTATTSAVVGATATSVTFINDVPGISIWVSGGKITPTDLIAEFAPGTLTTTPCATDGIANDTHLFTTCLGSNSLVGGIPQWVGTNATSFPLSLNGTAPTGGTSTNISQNANCMYTATGDNPTGIGATTIQAIIPATGSNNDVAIMSFSLALSVSYYAYNQCDTLHFENTVFAPTGGVTDMWYDSDTIYGPGPYSDHTGTHGNPAVNAAFYQTNGTRQSTTIAFSGATYAWGGHSQYGITDCINAALEEVSIECNNNGQTVLPLALGGNLNPDGSQWAFVSQSSNSAGANVQCSGVDCVSTTSVTFKIPQGSIPSFASPGWGLFVTCNMPTSGPPLNSNTTLIGNSLPITYLNNDTNPAVVTTSVPAGVACNISSHPAIQFLNFDHIDFDFVTFGGNLLPGGIRGFWQTYNSVIQENISGITMGTMEGWAYQGGRLFNFAIEDMHAGLSEPPAPTQMPYVTIGQGEVVGVYNIILRNDFFGTYVSGTTAPYLQLWQDFYVINDSGGTGSPAFPGSFGTTPDWNQVSFWNATGDIFQPLVGDTAVGGAQTNFTVWPTGTRGVDPTTGLPNSASAPFYNSMTAAPWYGILRDTGLGTQ